MKRSDKIKYVTPEAAYRHMTKGTQQIPIIPTKAARALSEAEKSRQAMLDRHRIQAGPGSASAAQENMIKRRQR